MAERLASLAMYDGGELAAANDVLWSAVARRLERLGMREVPRRLERDRALDDVWSSDRLLLGQTCGYPFAARFRGRLRLIATPRYSAPGCTESGHRTFVVVHARSTARSLSALRGTRAVINDVESMTGRHLLGDAIAAAGGARGFFASVEVSGSHARSLASVAACAADVAAIDCVSFAHLARAAPEMVAETRIIHRTRRTPALPFVISSACGDVASSLVTRALVDALADPSTADARRALMLVGVKRLAPSAYDGTLAVAANADRVFDA
ncbi:MAG: PhnD/SsuA/transferrin family substrate-binding protein [Labilithrix sp.]|nr:PhnD/SsuA/transferrin family substrate-binding protein [Labilithrix sp.]MCW5809745.1 PhnD/SsuA/transferrin family substrate-binding protein [Labilithrix sp.]